MSVHGLLAGYRALDLTDHRGALAGRLLADLGVLRREQVIWR